MLSTPVWNIGAPQFMPESASVIWLCVREEPLDYNRHDAIILGSGFMVAALATVLTVLTSAFLVWMPVRSTWINVQGRYFHPVIIALLMGGILATPFNVKYRSGVLM